MFLMNGNVQILFYFFSVIDMVSNIPDSMLNNRFGIAGLLSFIRGAETDPGICALAPGVDLTTLGLNLNSTE